MKKRIKWIVGAGVLAVAPLTLMAAPTANATGVVTCAFGTVDPSLISFADCSSRAVTNCLAYAPINQPVVEILGSTVAWVSCTVI